MASERKTTRRKMQPAGPLDWQSESSQYISWLRFQFLYASLKLRPEMEAGLRELVRLRTGAASDGEALLGYEPALGSWAKRYNLLEDKWCRIWFVDMLEKHSFATMTPNAHRHIVLMYTFDGPPPVQPPPLPDLAWNPFEISRQVMTRLYNEYLDKVEDTYRRVGYRSTPERRESAHIWWLAGYQVCGGSKNAIAEAVSVDRAAVIRAIQRLASLIDLTLCAAAANDRSWTPERIHAALPVI